MTLIREVQAMERSVHEQGTAVIEAKEQLAQRLAHAKVGERASGRARAHVSCLLASRPRLPLLGFVLLRTHTMGAYSLLVPMVVLAVPIACALVPQALEAEFSRLKEQLTAHEADTEQQARAALCGWEREGHVLSKHA